MKTCTHPDGCVGEPYYADGLCHLHYYRRVHTGTLGPADRLRNRNGEGNVNNHGYRRRGRRLEHRVVMEEHLGRPLESDEHVHHVNGDKLDNRIENLEIMAPDEHQRLHARTRGVDQSE